MPGPDSQTVPRLAVRYRDGTTTSFVTAGVLISGQTVLADLRDPLGDLLSDAEAGGGRLEALAGPVRPDDGGRRSPDDFELLAVAQADVFDLAPEPDVSRGFVRFTLAHRSRYPGIRRGSLEPDDDGRRGGGGSLILRTIAEQMGEGYSDADRRAVAAMARQRPGEPDDWYTWATAAETVAARPGYHRFEAPEGAFLDVCAILPCCPW